MMPPTSIDGTDITGATIDGTDVQEITVDGQTVFSAGPIPAKGVNRYQFNEGSGTTATDSIGSNDGTINGATYTTVAKEGSHALEFDGANDNVDLGFPGPYGDDKFSIAAWCKFDTLSPFNIIVGSFDGSFPQVKIDNKSSGKVQFVLGDGSNFTTIEGNVSTGIFTHFVGVRDGSQARFYIDGSRVATGSDGSLANDLRSGDVHLGERPDGNDDFDGKIDDVILFNDALTDSEVSDFYNSY